MNVSYAYLTNAQRRAISWLALIVSVLVLAYSTVTAVTHPGGKHKSHRATIITAGPVFTDPKAEKIAINLKVDPSVYYKVTAQTVSAIASQNAYLDDNHLLPVLPPGIQKEAAHLEAASASSGVPVNVLGTLATIESSGLTTAHSGADAYGLMQVVPSYHLQRYVKHGFLPVTATYADYKLAETNGLSLIPRSTYESVLGDPANSAIIGAEIYAENLATARKQESKLDPESPVIYARAAAEYNGGPALAGKPFKDFLLESQLYVNHVIRITIDLEVAARLRANGMKDHDILKAMQSPEMNARAYAYSKYLRGGSFDSYELSAHYCGYPMPGVDPSLGKPIDSVAANIEASYLAYRAGTAEIKNGKNNRYTIPATPGLRIWLAGGGIGLFRQVPDNANWRL